MNATGIHGECHSCLADAIQTELLTGQDRRRARYSAFNWDAARAENGTWAQNFLTSLGEQVM